MPEMWKRLELVALVVSGALCGAARAGGDAPYPVLYVSPNDHATGIPVTLSFRAFHLAELARTARVTITVPAAYGVHVGVRQVIGRAEVRRAHRVGGRATLYTGRIVAARRACGPRPAAASWEVRVRSKAGAELRLPLALAKQQHGYALTLCVPARAGILSGFDLALHHVFRSPRLPRRYLFAARVITGTGAYDLRSYENLAARLTLRAVYTRSTRSFTVTGTIAGDPRARSGATVYLYVAQSQEPSGYKNLAVFQTRRGGRFSFRTRIFPAPVSVFAYADSLHRRGCSGSTGGPCKAQTYDTITSTAFAVRQTP
jgi:hypothetical protein